MQAIFSSKSFPIFLLITSFCVLSLVATLYHSKLKFYDSRSVLCSDQGGHAIYLSGYFIYDFSAQKMPQKLKEKLALMGGFSIKNEKIFTKYQYGTALLMSPFWLVAHTLAKEKDGLSLPYRYSTNIASIFYMLFGLILLNDVLKKSFSFKLRMFWLVVCCFGTNIIYYTLFSPGMYHIFAFFANCLFIYGLYHYESTAKTKKYFLLISLSIALMFIIRMNNLVIYPFLVLFTFKNFRNFSEYFFEKIILIKQIIIPTILFCLIFYIPQALYNRFIYGSFIAESYPNESFLYLKNPFITEVFFSPSCGLLLYSPLLFIPLCSFLKLKSLTDKINNVLILLILSVFSYMYGSWWCYTLGCSFGYRTFTEHLPLFIIIGLFMISYLTKFINRNIIFAFCILSVLYTVKLMVGFNNCWCNITDDVWNWSLFLKKLTEIPPFFINLLSK